MLVTPIGDCGYQSFPLIEGNIYDISDEALEKLGKRELKWSTEEYTEKTPIYEETIEKDGTTTKTIVGYDETTKTRPILIENPISEEEIAEKRRNETLRRISELKRLLSESDYKCLKYVDGEFTEGEYAETKAQRHAWRQEINELEESL